jgi:uncharacterized protein YbaP (TraB family)
MGNRRAQWIALALLLALTAVFWWRHDAAVTARPALWQAVKGNRTVYLFGTIHAVPAKARWLSPKIEEAALQSEALMLEIANLEAERADRHVFEQLAQSSGLPPVADRLAPADRPRLAALIRKAPDAMRGIDGYESWGAALLVSAAASGDLGLSTDNAGEALFQRMFVRQRKPVIGLETVEGQLGLFDRLPEFEQRALLTEAIREGQDARRLYGDLYESWSTGNISTLEKQFLAPLRAASHRREVLLDNRNARWARRIDQPPKDNATKLFVAVGAGHLLGPGSVQSRLAMLGWKINRLQ